MQQIEHRTVASLLAGATQLSAGAAQHAATLGLVVGTKPLIDGEIHALTQAMNALREARQELRGLRNTHITSRKVAYDLASSIRDHLKRSFGRSYSPQWEGTGFSGSLKIPRKVSALEVLLAALKGFLAENPAYELPTIATAALAESAGNALTASRIAVQLKKAEVGGLLTARRQKEKVVRKRISWVVQELARVIGPIDDRWEAFGLNQPGLKQAPPSPQKVTAAVAPGGSLTVKWERAPRADYYRLWMKVVGVDEKLVPVQSPADLAYTLENVPGSREVEIAVSAVNNGGESALSAVISITTPG